MRVLTVILGLGGAVTPVQKVISMVRDLQTKVIMEGKKEAETYDKFACFCKDKSAEKIRDINEAKARVEELSATLSEKNSHRDQLDQTIADLQKDISETVAEIADEQKRRADAKAVYDTNELDLSKAVQALEEAIATLQASRSGLDKPALLSVKKTVKKAAYMAEALGFASNARALLQQIPEVPVADYDFHSGGIVGTLEQLLGSFRSKHQEIEDAETSEVAAHTSLVQTLKNRQSNLEADLQSNQEEREQTSQEIGTTSKDLTMTIMNLCDD
jgi:DNA repair exonuclease SbcCD ATPase subunit